jgi:DnaJ family protein C protein 28
MPNTDRLIDEIIKRAMEAGEFDNLPGTGKPIEWKDNPFTPNEWRMAEDLLKKNDLAYPWMEKRKEIEKLIIDLKIKIALMTPLSKVAEEEISNQILKINKEIFDYNLSVPGVRLQRRTITLEEILLSIKQEQDY